MSLSFEFSEDAADAAAPFFGFLLEVRLAEAAVFFAGGAAMEAVPAPPPAAAAATAADATPADADAGTTVVNEDDR